MPLSCIVVVFVEHCEPFFVGGTPGGGHWQRFIDHPFVSVALAAGATMESK